MAEEEQEIDLTQKFPEMTPIASSPSLFFVYGFGIGMYGRRDYDHETCTFVKTQALCALFIPLIPIAAYRVADARGGGWYFLGKVPLSGFCKFWNALVLANLLVLGAFIWWDQYTDTPEYHMGERLAEAREEAQGEDLALALTKYAEVTDSGTSHAQTAGEELKKLWHDRMANGNGDDAKQLVTFALERKRMAQGVDSGRKVAVAIGAAADRLLNDDARSAVTIMKRGHSLFEDPQAFTKKYATLLEAAVKQFPNDLAVVIDWADVLKARGETERCKKLLEPHAAKLGNTEGARILGQIYAREGNFEGAFRLLEPYAQDRLKKLHQAEKTWAVRRKQVEDMAMADLQGKKAGDGWYQQYNKANKTGQSEMVNAFIVERMKKDRDLAKAQQQMIECGVVVPVALDLGIVRLRRAQSMSDPEAKKTELQAAEKIFLSIRSVAGESDEYRLFYGQVLYWLERHKEGRALFDKMLARRKRDYQSLMSVANILRDVGDLSEARTLVEEAYNVAANEGEKYGAAGLRAFTSIDTEDKILWLSRSNPGDGQVKAELNCAKGHKAREEGRDDEAAGFYRKAIAGYSSLPRSTSMLNNCALIHLAVFNCTGDRASLKQSAAMLDESVSMSPSDSILLKNAAHTLLSVAAVELAGPGVDFRKTLASPSLDLLDYLVRTEAERDALMKRLKENKSAIRAMDHLNKALVLAPKGVSAYQGARSFHIKTKDLEGLKSLRERLRKVELDQTQRTKEIKEQYAGKKDQKYRKNLKAVLPKRKAALAKISEEKEKLSFAIAACELAQLLLGSDARYGIGVDQDEVVKMAERAYTARPSAETTSTLASCLMWRASKRLEGRHPSYAELTTRFRRSVGPQYLFPVALHRDPALRASAMADPDFSRGLELIKQQSRNLPFWDGPWHWKLFQHIDPKEAARVKTSIQSQKLQPINREIRLIINPLSATDILTTSWNHEMAGRADEARRVVEDAIKRGVPLPAVK